MCRLLLDCSLFQYNFHVFLGYLTCKLSLSRSIECNGSKVECSRSSFEPSTCLLSSSSSWNMREFSKNLVLPSFQWCLLRTLYPRYAAWILVTASTLATYNKQFSWWAMYISRNFFFYHALTLGLVTKSLEKFNLYIHTAALKKRA